MGNKQPAIDSLMERFNIDRVKATKLYKQELIAEKRNDEAIKDIISIVNNDLHDVEER